MIVEEVTAYKNSYGAVFKTMEDAVVSELTMKFKNLHLGDAREIVKHAEFVIEALELLNVG